MRYSLIRFAAAILAGLALMPAIVMGSDDADFSVLVKQFSGDRHRLASRLAKQLDIPEPEGMKKFFEAAEQGDWLSVSNRFKAFLRTSEPSDGVRPEAQNELWSPILETLGIYEVMIGWKRDSALLKMFYDPILSSMPKGSIYLGGTDYGRFVITAVNAFRPESNVFCITQNALADNSHMAHLRAVYGKDLWIPESQDSSLAFQRYVSDVQSGKRQPNSDIKIENGRVQVSGVLGVMEINGILCNMLFEHNRDNHEFFVEESYVIDWMYPYLEPHGLIMRLNKKPLPDLKAETIQRNRAFWKDCITALLENSGFKSSPDAQNAFGKLRCAIAGIYVFREQYDEAEICFAQAFSLCPFSPEAHFRLARLHEKRGRIKEAIELMEKYVSIDPETRNKYVEPRSLYSLENAREYLVALHNKRPMSPQEEQRLTELIQQLGAHDSRIRSAAREKLRAFGARAVPLLKTYHESEDPEIRVTVKALIQQIENSAEQTPVRDRLKAPSEE